MTARLVHLYRYPVKGLSGELLPRADLVPDRTISGDRRFAFARPGTSFDASAPAWQPKTRFLALMRDARLARLRTHFEDATATLTVWEGREPVLRTRLDTPDGRAAAADWFTQFMEEEIDGAVSLCEAPGHSFSDVAAQVVSIVNLASVGALSEALDAPVDHRRFRANVYIDGLDAWQEFDWVGHRLRIGEAELEVTKRIQRCAATNVNPATAARDMNLPGALAETWGHADLGVYARVVTGGPVTPGLPVEPLA